MTAGIVASVADRKKEAKKEEYNTGGEAQSYDGGKDATITEKTDSTPDPNQTLPTTDNS